jgi:hypothetical protein
MRIDMFMSQNRGYEIYYKKNIGVIGGEGNG